MTCRSVCGFIEVYKIRPRLQNVCSFKLARRGLALLFLLAVILLLLSNYFTPAYKKKYSIVKHKEAVVNKEILNKQINSKDDSTKDDDDTGKCEVIHVGTVCAGYKSNSYLYAMLKSIYFYRNNPLHFHILTNKVSRKILETLFETWAVPQVNVTFYDINETIPDVRWVPNSHYSGVYGLLKLTFPKIISVKVTAQIIVLDTDLTFTGDIAELWKLFKDFNQNQVLGIVENQSNFYLGKIPNARPWPAIGRGFNSGLLLYKVDRLKKLHWDTLWVNVTKRTALVYGATRLGDQDVINAVAKENPDMFYEVPCQWNTQLSMNTRSELCYENRPVKIIHWNSPKKINVENKHAEYFKSVYYTFLEFNGNLLKRQLYDCSESSSTYNEQPPIDVCSPFRLGTTNRWRTFLFYREYKHVQLKNDVTFVAQLSHDRLQMVEELCKHWEGPISLALYVTDPELQLSNSFIENSEILKDRLNIAYHIVFKYGDYYPINVLRNVALKNVDTPYVFLADVDFLPMHGLYGVIKNYIEMIKDMKKKALIVPAFETQAYRSKFPKNKKELLSMIDKKLVHTFRYDVWASGHAPTNYSRWRTEEYPYTVKWEPDFEPYVVVSRNVIEYDDRFMGFGWNKVSHIMELEAARYEFMVLPNAFIIHKPHSPSYDIGRFRTSPVYRMCLENLKNDFVSALTKKYGRVFDNRTMPMNG